LHSDNSTVEYACAQLGVSRPADGVWSFQPTVLKKLMKGIPKEDKRMVMAELGLTVQAFSFLPSRVGKQPEKHDKYLDHGPQQYRLLDGLDDLSAVDFGDLVEDLYDTAYVVASVGTGYQKVLRTNLAGVMADGHWCECQILPMHPMYQTVVTRLNVLTDGVFMHELYLSTLLGKAGGLPTKSCPPITFRKHSKEQGA
jgi:hypothetical protein